MATVFKTVSSFVSNHTIKRMVIDPVSAIRFAAKDPAAEKKEMARFLHNLKKSGCTVLMLDDSSMLLLRPLNTAPQMVSSCPAILRRIARALSR
jgi:KaiC/GvpD/RAD55 family RecA-like ATPase